MLFSNKRKVMISLLHIIDSVMKKVILITTSSFREKGLDDEYMVVYNPYNRKLTEEEAIQLVSKYQPIGMIAGVEPLTRKVIEQSKELRVISRCGVGLDSVDIQAAKDFGIVVTITPEGTTVAVAELTIGLILSSLLHIPLLDNGIRNGDWKGEKGKLLSGKTIGIIGCGRIGTKVAEICKCFSCHIIGFDMNIQKHENIEVMQFEDVLKKSDILTLHIPMNDKNKHIIGCNEINSMKQGSIIINTARGGLIDEDALYKSLCTGKLYSAALDCFENEPYSGKLLNAPNLIMTPHMGSSAIEARRAMEKQAVKNLMYELKVSKSNS